MKTSKPDHTPTIAIIGLGYVGLPLALAFSEKYKVIGYDIDASRVLALNEGIDITMQVTKGALSANNRLTFTDSINEIQNATVYIITVPTPVHEDKTPDLEPLLQASAQIAALLKQGDIVVYESTVYPGCTEEECVPVIEEISGLKFNQDFYCGYSPERINPGDQVNTLTKIKKITSGSTPTIAVYIDQLYASIISAGTHLAPSIKVAEAAKSIENAQRDINISFVNELALIFDRMGIDTHEVLEAASTKWNFLPFKPGLVGGHCIGVDPYYLLHKAEAMGLHPRVIAAGRFTNDNMPAHIAQKAIKKLNARGKVVKDCRILIMGATFKENVADIRNSKIVDVVNELISYSVNVDVVDPYASSEELKHEYGFDLAAEPCGQYDGIILAVSHDQYKNLPTAWFEQHATQDAFFFDIKALFRKPETRPALDYWSL